MKHVLLVSNTTRNIYHYRRAVWRDLLARGYRVTAVAAPDANLADLRAAGIAVHAVPQLAAYGSSPYQLYRIYRLLVAAYTRIRPDAILHFTIQANTLGSLAAGRCGIPSAATVTGLGTTWLASRLSRWLTIVLYRCTLPLARLVITQNVADAEELRGAGIRAGEWRTIGGSGVDTEQYTVRAPGELPAEKTYLYFGRMLTDKGVGELFAAWKLAWAAGLRGRLMLVGERPTEHPRVIPGTVWREGLSLPGVTYRPATDHVIAILRESHFVVLPSYREGLSRSLLEALATGTPVITTDVPGCRELVEGRGTGWMVDVKSPTSLAMAMLEADQTSNPAYAAMGRRGWQLVRDRYSAGIVAGAYSKVVEDLTVGP